MEFMMGMYVEDWSGETESTSIRGSIEDVGPSSFGPDAVVLDVILFMSTDL